MAENGSLDQFLSAAIDAAQKAGQVIRKGFYETKHVEHKGQVDLVTETDKGCEELVFNHLKHLFPNHKFIGEETTAANGVTELTDEPTWIVDPLDGTTNFVHGFPFVCVSIGLTIGKVPVVGVVYNPIMDELFTGVQGKGAFLNGKPITVSTQSELVTALLLAEAGTKRDKATLDDATNRINSLLTKVRSLRMGGSCALDLCGGTDLAPSVKGMELGELSMTTPEQERPAAFVFFKTRYDALVVSEVLQSSNPMLWVTDLAPEPHDVFWRNLNIPYRQLWIRRIATLVGAVAFMFVFLIPVAFIQGLTQLEHLSHAFPFLRGILKKQFINQVITGYLPSVILILFFYAVPPLMMYFSTLEGSISRSIRKKSACIKVLYFTIWNVFFVNILSGSVIRQLNVFSSVRDIPEQLARAVPTQAGFFTTYCFTSGWASLACEIMQPMALIWNLVAKAISKNKDESYETLRFPFHTEVPRLLLFGLLGFTNSVIAPLILPFLLIYFFLAYLIYKNQILNVYITKYESGGQYWPIFHNTTIFSLILTQIIALGFFGLKLSTVASGFTIPLILLTLLFSEYCRHRFGPIFHKHPAQVLIDMDRADEMAGKMDELHKKLHNMYSQIPLHTQKSSSKGECSSPFASQELPDPEKLKPEEGDAIAKELWGYQGSESGQEHEDKPCPSASSPEHLTPKRT